MNYTKIIFSYTISYIVLNLIFIYLLNLPQIITKDKKNLIQYYYYDNFYYVIIFDYFLIAFYLLFNYYLIKKFKFTKLYQQILVNIFGTLLISGFFLYYFLSKPLNKNIFFSKWFYSVKWRAVYYDILLVVICFIMYKFIYNRIKQFL